jgi:hypothetical protein
VEQLPQKLKSQYQVLRQFVSEEKLPSEKVEELKQLILLSPELSTV